MAAAKEQLHGHNHEILRYAKSCFLCSGIADGGVVAVTSGDLRAGSPVSGEASRLCRRLGLAEVHSKHVLYN